MKSKHTDEQLSWLRSHLAEYETRAGGNVRGDAKKFALEMATKYIEKWGVVDGEKETTMKEQIYTWFKNTSARGKEARKRHQLMKKAERPSTAYLTVPNIEPPSHNNASTSQLRYQQPQPPPPPLPPVHYPPPLAIPRPQPSTHFNTTISVHASAVRDTILNATCDRDDVATSFQLCEDTNHMMTGLLAAAVIVTSSSTADLSVGDPLQHILHRYYDAADIWPRNMAYRSYSGHLAAKHLLYTTFRKQAVWTPVTPFPHHSHDMQEEITRVTLDRQRRRDHVLWARMHAAALEIQRLDNSSLAETLANDGMWEEDEVEWVAGCVLLKGLVRAGKVPMSSSTLGWADLMHSYQSKWKEVRDEGRQTLMAETLLEIRKTLEGHPRM